MGNIITFTPKPAPPPVAPKQGYEINHNRVGSSHQITVSWDGLSERQAQIIMWGERYLFELLCRGVEEPKA